MKQPEKFEEQMRELEQIVDDLSHSTDLEESLKKFERGLALAETANQRLNQIENRLIEIKEKFKAPDKSEILEEDEPINF